MDVYRARWVLPIHSPPLADGAVAIEEGRIVGVGPYSDLKAPLSEATWHDLGDAILMPSLVNAHVHLALTDQAGQHPAGAGLMSWLKSLVPAARAMDSQAVVAATRRGAEQSRRAGVGLAGEIASRPEVVEGLRGTGLAARVFFEVLGVSEQSAERTWDGVITAAEALHLEEHPDLRAGLSPHAPYSVTPSLWDRALGWCRERELPWTSHVAESPHEAEFLTHGTGQVRDYLDWLGVWDGTFPIQGMTGVRMLDARDHLDEGALLVHGVCLDRDEMDRLAVTDTALCVCPGSNRWLGLPDPPIAALHEAGVFLCLGTDSAASNQDLDLWREMRLVRELAPGLPASTLLRMATAHGAMALGFTGEYGLIAPGARASLIRLEVPPSTDPETAVLERGSPERVTWVSG